MQNLILISITMTLNSIFQFLFPKDKKFFPLFEQATANLFQRIRIHYFIIFKTHLYDGFFYSHLFPLIYQ